jgi:hypothetical protein
VPRPAADHRQSRKQPGQVATTGAGGGPVHLAIFLLAAMRLGPAHAYGAIDTAVHRRKVDVSNQHDTTWQQGPRRHAEQGFGAPTRVFNAVNLADDREVLSIGFVGVEPEALPAGIARVGAQEQRRHGRIVASLLRAFMVAEAGLADPPPGRS